MIIRIYYDNCFIDIDLRNFKTIEELEAHIHIATGQMREDDDEDYMQGIIDDNERDGR